MARPATQDYDELTIRVKHGGSGGSWVMLESRAGSAEGQLALRVHEEEVKEALGSASHVTQSYLTRGQGTLDPVKEIGESLFSSLFEGRRRSLFRRAQELAESEDRGLRLRLEIDDARLASSPWEFLHDGRDFICLAGNAPIVRTMPRAVSPASVDELSQVRTTVRMLVVTANVGHAVSDADFQVEKLRASFSNLDLEIVRDTTLGRLRDAILGTEFEIFQFIGSGTDTDPNGQNQALAVWGQGSKPSEPEHYALVGSRELGEMLAWKPGLRLVYLNAASSDLIARDLSSICPGVVGIRGLISIDACRAFTEGFFTGILSGQPLETAVTRGRQEIDIRIPGSREWGMIVFYLQRADGALFTRQRSQEASIEPLEEREELLASRQAPERSAEWRKLQALLAIHRKNLEVLLQQALYRQQATVPGSAEPSSIQSEIDQAMAEISKLEKRLEES